MKPVSVDRLDAGPGWRPGVHRLAELATVIAGLGRPEWQVELAWVEDAEMGELNGRWRGREGLTDVLSFGNLTCAGAGDPVLRIGTAGAAGDLWWEDGLEPPGLQAGEIVIAPRFVQRRCAERGWDFAGELALLVAHGALHLLGWEHDTSERTDAMRELERGALERAGRDHPMLDGAGGEPDRRQRKGR
ncbi:rRNA maturation RNase YbeY [bacterium]|nr:rRNA maturation RNase YbeY [bacterium]